MLSESRSAMFRLRGLQEVLPLTLTPPAGSSAPVSLAASLRLPPQTASPVAAGNSGSGGPARPWLPPPTADARMVAAIGGLASAPQQRPVVRISGLLLPDGLTPAVDDGQEAQELGAALGYVALFLDLAAAYLGSPLLHRVRRHLVAHLLMLPSPRTACCLCPLVRLRALGMCEKTACEALPDSSMFFMW